jgi:hypothetical protein
MQADRMFDFYTDAGMVTLSLFCGQAKLIGRLEGEANRPGTAELNPQQIGRSPDVAEAQVGPEAFEGETEEIVIQAAKRWVEDRLGPIRTVQERGCGPD